jgi:hypothetical protein
VGRRTLDIFVNGNLQPVHYINIPPQLNFYINSFNIGDEFQFVSLKRRITPTISTVFVTKQDEKNDEGESITSEAPESMTLTPTTKLMRRVCDYTCKEPQDKKNKLWKANEVYRRNKISNLNSKTVNWNYFFV